MGSDAGYTCIELVVFDIASPFEVVDATLYILP